MCCQGHAEDFKPLTEAEPLVWMVLQEANNEPYAGMVAVVGVALDRVSDPRWPDTEADVVYQGSRSLTTAQFSGMSIKLRDYGERDITRARNAVEAAKAGSRPCGTVLYFHTDWVSPSWDYSKIEVACQLGDHIFYRDKKS